MPQRRHRRAQLRPGVAERLGLDRPTLLRINPQIITLETSAYGSTGPLSTAPGFDMVMQPRCGLQRRAGGYGNEPRCSRTPLLDFAAGAHGAIGLLVALFERLRHGRSSHVTTNLADVGLHVMSELVRAPGGNWLGAPLLNAAQTGFGPYEAIYRTSDGWVAIAARSSEMRERLADILGLPVSHEAVDRETEYSRLGGPF